MIMSWQLRLIDHIHAIVRTLDSVAEMWVFGSAAEPDLMDRWSDIDVGVVLRADLDLGALVTSIGQVWVHESSSDGDGSTHRLVFTDGRRLDLVVADHADLAGRGGRRLSLPDRAAGRAPKARATLSLPPLDEDVRQARFLAALATIKIARGDLLIGTHLTLELAQLCLVQAMLLRDHDEGRTSHRFGTPRDRLAEQILQVTRRPAGPDWITVITDLTEHFDRCHQERDRDYRPDWSGLRALGA